MHVVELDHVVVARAVAITPRPADGDRGVEEVVNVIVRHAIVRALESDGIVRSYPAQTIADGISVSLPRNGAMSVKVIRGSGGFGITVSDEEILLAEKQLATLTGVFAEPSGAASYAGLVHLLREDRINRAESTVLLVTGSGLKSIDAVVGSAGSVVSIEKGSEGMKKVEEVVKRL